MAEEKRRWRLVGRTRTGRKIYLGTRTVEDRIFAKKQQRLYRGVGFTPRS